jgi:hypothetical protein
VDIIPWVFTTGWASGINAYLVVVLLGGVERFHPLTQIPDVLARTDVLVVAGVLFLLEMFADKIPYVDSVWDSVHTVVRPAVGTALAYLIAGDASSMEQALAATTGGVTALASHAVTAGLRAAANTTPEPASNIVLSVGEDVTAASVVSLAIIAPYVAAGIAALLLFVGLSIVIVLFRRIMRWRRNRRRKAAGSVGESPAY